MSSVSDVLIIHGKEFVRSPDQVEIARVDDWMLHRLPPSKCGKYQNFKLYFTGERAKKRVWNLGVGLFPFGLIPNRGVGILKEYYGGMDQWVLDAINGEVRPIPKFAPRSIKEAPVRKVLGDDILAQIRAFLDVAWENGRPLSIFGQTRKSGRYAPKIISDAMKISQIAARDSILSMLMSGHLETEMFNTNTKMKGLRATEPTNSEGSPNG